MPKKVASWGMQEYVPAGNGDPSGEYANDEGNNIHYFAKFAKPKSEIKQEVSESKPAKKEEIKLEAQTENDSLQNFVSKQNKKVKKLDKSFLKDVLKNSYTDVLDPKKLEGISDEEAQNLAVALNVLDNKDKIIGDAKKEIQKEKDAFLEEVGDLKYEYWLNFPEDPESFDESVQKKIDFFQSKGKDDVVSQLKKLKESENLKKWKKAQESSDKDFEKYQKIVSKYENPDYPYSQKRKDDAFWAKNYYQAQDKFKAVADKKIAEWKEKDEKALKYIKDYTGSYSSINSPLRATDYPYKNEYPSQSKEKQKDFIERVNGMTKVLDDSTYDFDCWVQRGVSKLNINGKTLEYKGSVKDLKGITFKDQGFLSCGSAKGSGFTDKSIIMNIYCPKGTKMLYVDPISYYSGAHENETIIQRGYSYKITKAEKKNGMIYLDCEVILGSDATKWNNQELEDLAKKHF